MINKSRIISPADDDEVKLTLSKAADLYTKALNTSKPFFTKFLTPAESAYILSRFPHGEVGIGFFGGYDSADRTVCRFSIYDDDEKFPISALNFKIKSKNAVLNHRDYLGSLMSLGIKRETVGDIVISDSGAVVFCLDEISDYIIQNLLKIGKVGISITRLGSTDDLKIKKEYDSHHSAVSSLRCDSIVSAATNLSRGKTADLIEKGLVTLNYETAKSAHHMLKDSDVISIKGFGKFRLQTDGSLTKKGRINITLLKFK